jgi:hypothetical protein
MNSDLLVGAVAYGKSGQGLQVARVDGDRVTLLSPNGPLTVLRSAVVRWQLPAQMKCRCGEAFTIPGLDHSYCGSCRVWRATP